MQVYYVISGLQYMHSICCFSRKWVTHLSSCQTLLISICFLNLLSFASSSLYISYYIPFCLVNRVHLSISFDAWLFSEASFVPNCLQSFLNDIKWLSPQPIPPLAPPQQTAHIWMHLRSLDYNWEFTGEQAVNSFTPLSVGFLKDSLCWGLFSKPKTKKKQTLLKHF